MLRSRRLRWIAVTLLSIVAALTFTVGAEAYADEGHNPCQASARVAHDGSWRTGGFRSAGCRAWHHLHHSHEFFGRIR